MEMPPPEIWRKEIIRLKKRIDKIENHDDLIVFYGSSSVRLWVNMKKDLAPLNVLNLGFGGSSFDWCFYYFDELFEKLRPEKIVLYGGENDISHGTTTERVLHNFERLYEKCLLTYPGVEMATISLKPSVKRTDLIPKIMDVNRLINRYLLTQEEGAFIEVFSKMLDEKGHPNEDLFLSDGLHMNKEGYKIWTTVVREHFGI